MGMIFTFGMLNMVVALVVEKTLEQTRLMGELKKLEMRDQLVEELVQVKTFFLITDEDGSGTLTKAEFDRALNEHPPVKDVFHEFDIDTEDATELFSVLDWDRSGSVTIKELIEGISKV